MRLPNSPEVDELRRALQLALPYGLQTSVAAAAGRSLKAVQHQVDGSNALTLDVFLAALIVLPESESLRIAARALAPSQLVIARLRPGRLLPAITPATASVFPIVGHLAEAAALAEADGTVTREEGEAIRAEAEKATALLAAIVTTAEVAAGARLA
jgi:hypothetical protein